jgi:riboflavin kinase/FMN adenylyltransferase
MLHTTSLNDVQLNDTWLTIGVFDGVHRGHQAILRHLVEGAHAAGNPAVVLTFSSHPAVVLGHRELKYLTTPEERAELLGALGVDTVITHPFDEKVAGLTAAEFMAPLKSRLGLNRLLIGYDFALGKGREGTAARLSEIGREMGYSVQVVEAVSDESGVISSSAIRKLIAVGKVAEAAEMLGRFYALGGPVIHGDARGKTIGIPTANVDFDSRKVLPANGVYACWTTIDGLKHRSVANIGLRPTFAGGDPNPRVETHLLDYDQDLYGKTLRLEFTARLRDEMKFPSVDALTAQIKSDIQTAETLLK